MATVASCWRMSDDQLPVLIEILPSHNSGYRQQIHAVYYRDTQLA